jgi:hypothetical protein
MSTLHCNICDTKLYNLNSFKRHLTSVKHKENNIKYQESLELEHCSYCDKKYKHKSSLSRHEAKCKISSALTHIPHDLISEPENNINNKTGSILPANSINNGSIQSANTINNGSIQSATTINNGTINNTNVSITQNITIVPFGREDLSMLTDEIKKKIVEREKRAFITLINETYKNKKNLNIFVSDKRNGLVKYLDENNQVQQSLLKVKAEEFMENNKKIIDDLIDEYIDCFRQPTQNRLLDIKSDHAFGSFDNKYLKLSKEKILEITGKSKNPVKNAEVSQMTT